MTHYILSGDRGIGSGSNNEPSFYTIQTNITFTGDDGTSGRTTTDLSRSPSILAIEGTVVMNWSYEAGVLTINENVFDEDKLMVL